jgi:hypothetical protein
MQHDDGSDPLGDDSREEPLWWRESSFDLRRGLEVEDASESTIPGELLDELVQQERRAAPADAAGSRLLTVLAVNPARRRAAIFEDESRVTIIEWVGGCKPEVGDAVRGVFDSSRIVRLLNLTRDCVMEALVRSTGAEPGSAEALLA